MTNFKYVSFVNIVLVLVGAALIIAIAWIIKAYFQINTRQIKKADIYYVDQENLNAANNTITESNNELSTRSFDGVNRNPEHNDNKNLRKKNVMDSDRCIN